MAIPFRSADDAREAAPLCGTAREIVAARHALEILPRDNFETVLRLLRDDGVLPRQPADLFHYLRRVGKAAIHNKPGTPAEALGALKQARLPSTTVEFGDQVACRCGVVSSDRSWRRLDAGLATMTRPGRVRASEGRAVAGG